MHQDQRPHSGKYCYGKTPLQTFVEAKHIAQEKMIGETRNPHREKKENKPEEKKTEKVTTSEMEGIR